MVDCAVPTTRRRREYRPRTTCQAATGTVYSFIGHRVRAEGTETPGDQHPGSGLNIPKCSLGRASPPTIPTHTDTILRMLEETKQQQSSESTRWSGGQTKLAASAREALPLEGIHSHVS